jgi:hypothetical protein
MLQPLYSLGPTTYSSSLLLQVCPDALLDDGLLDFTLWTGESLTSEVRRKYIVAAAAAAVTVAARQLA